MKALVLTVLLGMVGSFSSVAFADGCTCTSQGCTRCVTSGGIFKCSRVRACKNDEPKSDAIQQASTNKCEDKDLRNATFSRI